MKSAHPHKALGAAMSVLVLQAVYGATSFALARPCTVSGSVVMLGFAGCVLGIAWSDSRFQAHDKGAPKERSGAERSAKETERPRGCTIVGVGTAFLCVVTVIPMVWPM